jgi:hypothetical protein|tara:strand:+ start:980 stop:1378 length:399 start_codon:yes stop_codon:yes gene_type:complete
VGQRALARHNRSSIASGNGPRFMLNNTDFKHRFFATCVSEIGVVDMTGKWFSESPIPSWKFYSRQLAATVSMRTPIYSENNANYHVSVMINWCRLLLPMVDEKGAIDRILVAIIPVDRNREHASQVPHEAWN